LVPIESLQIIAHKLFVETGRALTDNILVFRPEPRRIRRETVVDQQKFSVDDSEFELRVGDDDAALSGVIASRGINFQTKVARFHGNIFTENPATFVPIDVEI